MKNSVRSGTIEQRLFMTAPALLWQVLFLLVPVAVIFCISFIKQGDLSFLQQLTLSNYAAIINFHYAAIIFRSLVLAFCNALLCLVIGYPVAYFLAMQATRWKNLLLLLLILPFWTNILVQVYAWFFVLDNHGLINRLLLWTGIINTPLQLMGTSLAIYVVMLFCYLPFMILPLYTGLEKVNKQLLEASADLGANPWSTFRRITWPLSLSGVKTGFFLVFIPSFGEFVIPTLMGGGKTMYVGSLISHYFIESRNLFLGSAFTIVSGFVLLVISLLIQQVFKYSLRSTGGNDGNF